MRILLIGGNGFIGAPLARELSAAGHQVAIFHRGTAISSDRFFHLQGDRHRLGDYFEKIRDFSPQVIVDVILSSGQQAQQLVDVARDLNARVVAISSMDVYRAAGILQGSESGEVEAMPLTEDSPLSTGRRMYAPELVEKMKSTYPWLTADYSKAAVEEAVMSGGAENSVVRLPFVYGPEDRLHRLWGVLKRVWDGRPAILLPDDYAAWCGPRGYVENTAHAIALACTSERARGRIYHVCDEPTVSELQWQEKIAEQAHWRGRFVVLPRAKTPKHLLMPGNAAQHLVADCGRIRRELGYEQPVSTEQAILRTIEWQLRNPPRQPLFAQFDYAAEDAALAGL